MVEAHAQNQNETLRTPDNQAETTNKVESSVEKMTRQRRQKQLVHQTVGKILDEADADALVKYAGECSSEEFQKLLSGDPAKENPSLFNMVRKEQLWKAEVDNQERTNKGFKQRLAEKIKLEPTTDRRILMAETAWEMEYEKMEDIMPSHLKSDLKKYYGTYDRKRAKLKHGIAAKNNPIPDCEEVTARMKKGITQRIIMEYTMLAKEHFPPRHLEEWTNFIENIDDPEKAIAEYNEMIGEGKNEVGYIQAEETFNARRDELIKNNPAAHDFFLRMYNKSTEVELFATRDEVMDQAITHIDTHMQELAGLTEDQELLDLTQYENIEAIIAQINTLKGNTEETDVETETTEDLDPAALRKAKDEAEEQMYEEDRDLRNLMIHEMALENAAKAAQISERQSDDVVKEKERRQMVNIREQRLKDQVATALGNTEEKQQEETKFTDSDIAMNTTVIGTDVNEGLEIKDSDKIADLGQIIKDTQGVAAKEGLDFLTVTDQRGQTTTAKNMQDAAENVRARRMERKKQLLKNRVKAGTLDAQVLDLSKGRETAQEREKNQKTVLDNLDKVRKTA